MQAILPTAAFAVKPTYAEGQYCISVCQRLSRNDAAKKWTDMNQTLTNDDIFKYHVISSDGLTILNRLNSIGHPVLGKIVSDNVEFLRCVTSFTDLSDPWTCESSRHSALQLLEAFSYSHGSKDLLNILSSLLQEDVKPAFVSTRNSAITQQARMAIDPLSVDPLAPVELDNTTRPWKNQDVYLVTVLGWIIRSLKHMDVSSCVIVYITLSRVDHLAGIIHRIKLVAYHPTNTGPHRRFVHSLQSERLCLPK